ncbi:3'(2'),5'-bisphosphate nucleotidase CysQ family protein [Calothrix sp. 336/3]|uniref:3'(2'),5'-bisphosphate nucleotidase CysQ family protein n=1 Tax=Calothrix sp. 336/3 TaxID=1337936 RepID=UPI0004E2E22B|nr:3'(2'),5'-bisphosphate nucleotidase CysQ [Calothrix sp. 336/3]AKG23441.1 ammonium transporter [Calothrix sp. 336/3]
MSNLPEILSLTRTVAWEAANILRSYYNGTESKNLNTTYKDDEPVTAADMAVNQHILQRLQAELGNLEFTYITEETYKTGQSPQNHTPWAWIIDPLDGTRDFIEKTGEYAIHLALVQEHRPILSVVAIPEAEKIYYAIKDGGSFVETINGTTKPLKVSSDKPLEDLTLVVSRSHRNQRLNHLLANLPCQNHKSVGSVGGKIATIVEQQADIYISLSGKSAPKDWDIAAPELILTEAGGKFTHFDGSPLLYNTGEINQWGGLLASNGEHHQILCNTAESILQNFSPQE